jgi:hypothetical protein
MERWKIYKESSGNYSWPIWLSDMMDIRVRMVTQMDNIFNGRSPYLLERVESGNFKKVISTNGRYRTACIEYGNLDR